MIRLLHDRYVALGGNVARDLVTGRPIKAGEIPEQDPTLEAWLCAGSKRHLRGPDLAVLSELLEQGRDGEPRWVTAAAPTAGQAGAIARRAAIVARDYGFVAVSVDLYRRFRELLRDELQDRSLLLIGGFDKAAGAAQEALLNATAMSPRPHVLLTFTAPGMTGGASVLREARVAYEVEPAPLRRRIAAAQPDVRRYLEHMARAAVSARSGRHAQAERLLREAAGALERRDAFIEAVDATTDLGRLLQERGRTADAEIAFCRAAGLAERGGDLALAARARIWQAWVRIDEGKLTDAESLVRAALLTGVSTRERSWAHVALARCLLGQGRVADAAAVPLDSTTDHVTDASRPVDAVLTAMGDEIAVRVQLAQELVFAAGQRARSALQRAPADDVLAGTIAYAAHLRVLCAAGDLALAADGLARVVRMARMAHAPLQAVRARLIWVEALRRAGRPEDARREAARLQRAARIAPLSMRRAIEASCAPSPERMGARPRGGGSPVPAASLIKVAQDEDDDMTAVRRVVERVAADLNTSRVDLVSAAAGPATVILTIGRGLPTSVGPRVLESGVAVGCDEGNDVREAGMPIRLGSQLLAALVCRWALDRRASPDVRNILDITAAIVAPRVEGLLTRAREEAGASTSIPELLGPSHTLQEVRKAIARAASAPFSVLIEGESGTGKELVARAIHQLGPRRERRFCDVNCGALPDDLLESELFGHARGAFTGAVVEREGMFEAANGGTLFLDEVADLSSRAQAKLLRVVQQQEVRRVGETFSRPVDVRLVAAANRDMRAEVIAGRFRQDLLYRLDVIRIAIPPLRERPDDVAVLAEAFWRVAAERVGSHATLTSSTLAELARYHWPGNVRELQNVMAALAVAAPSRGRVRPSLLPSAIGRAATISSGRLLEARTQFERRFVEAALARSGGNRTRAAQSLGISRQGLMKTLARLRIQVVSEDRT